MKIIQTWLSWEWDQRGESGVLIFIVSIAVVEWNVLGWPHGDQARAMIHPHRHHHKDPIFAYAIRPSLLKGLWWVAHEHTTSHTKKNINSSYSTALA